MFESMTLANAAFLSGGLNSGDATLVIASGANWPTNLSGQFRVLIDAEIIGLRGVSGVTTYDILNRGMESTTQAEHAEWAAAMHVLTPQAVLNTTGGVNTQTGTSYTIGATDARSLVTFSNGSAIAVTLPQATTGDVSNFGPHFWITLLNLGAGAVTIAPTTSTINGAATLVLDTNKSCTIWSDGTNYNATTGVGSTVASGQVGSGSIQSGAVMGFFGPIRNIASGTVGVFDFGSGAVTAGTVGSGSIVSGNIASGVVGLSHIASGAVGSGRVGNAAILSGNIGSGQISRFLHNSIVGSGNSVVFSDAPYISDPTFTNTADFSSGTVDFELCTVSSISGTWDFTGAVIDFDRARLLASGSILYLPSGSVWSGNILSGAIGRMHLSSGAISSGHLANNAVVSGSIASGNVDATHTKSGIIQGQSGILVDHTAARIMIGSNITAGAGTAGTSSGSNSVCDIRISLCSDQSVYTSGDIISLTTSSGRLTSGSAMIFLNSGLQSGLCPGMLIVTSGFSHGTAIIGFSGIAGVVASTNSIYATSGASIQFIPGVVYAVPHVGNRISLYDGTNWPIYVFTSGTNSSLKMYDHTQSGIIVSGDTRVSGLTDTFQLTLGMEAVLSGLVASGAVITAIGTVGSVTLSKAAVSGLAAGSTGSILFRMPDNSGTLASGGNWDIFSSVRSGVPWLQWGNQWDTTTARLDAIYSQEGVWSNSGVVN